jgi:hypothetical protein
MKIWWSGYKECIYILIGMRLKALRVWKFLMEDWGSVHMIGGSSQRGKKIGDTKTWCIIWRRWSSIWEVSLCNDSYYHHFFLSSIIKCVLVHLYLTFPLYRFNEIFISYNYLELLTNVINFTWNDIGFLVLNSTCQFHHHTNCHP